MNRRYKGYFIGLLLMILTLTACEGEGRAPINGGAQEAGWKEKLSEAFVDKWGIQGEKVESTTLENGIPPYQGEPYVVLGDGEPGFTEQERTTKSYETYSELDMLGRCGMAVACIGQDLMPTEKRGNIGQVHPSGWHTRKYDHVDGKYLYNRCHLIGYQLAAENANEKNLITGTRYFNVDGMLPFENMVADYVKETNNHVMYRVTPVYTGDNLVAEGVIMEAESVEDQGDGISYCVFVYNVQPGVVIDYATGESQLGDPSGREISVKSPKTPQKKEAQEEVELYILNKGTKKFHRESCDSIHSIKEENMERYEGSRAELMEQGYEPCKKCNP